MSDEEPQGKVIRIPYTPRRWFKPIHESEKRRINVVAHRRAGKTVALCNQSIRKALTNTRKFPPPRYAYVGPSFAQTKDLVWGYYKHYVHPIPGHSFSESDLTLTLPNGAKISLYGGQAYERMRGLYFDGVVMDEYAMFPSEAWPLVIRPTLSDYRGWAIISGTSNGDDHFKEHILKCQSLPDWDNFVIPVTETDALHEDELADMRLTMTPEQYAREMLCSFDTPVEGAYYADLINEAEEQGRITHVPYDPSAPVVVFWDLGISDDMSLWFTQRVGREYHAIDYYENRGEGLPHYFKYCAEKPYVYAADILPHDVKARELGTGKSRYEVFMEYGRNVYITPMHRIEDRISAVRNSLPMWWFDKEKCAAGIRALKAYRSNKSDKLGFTKPVHNWASHGSDSFGGGVMSIEQVVGWSGNFGNKLGALRRRIRGLA